jgi:hypothetical protein
MGIPHMEFMLFFLHSPTLITNPLDVPCVIVSTRLAISLEQHRMMLYGKN